MDPKSSHFVSPASKVVNRGVEARESSTKVSRRKSLGWNSNRVGRMDAAPAARHARKEDVVLPVSSRMEAERARVSEDSRATVAQSVYRFPLCRKGKFESGRALEKAEYAAHKKGGRAASISSGRSGTRE